MQVLGIRRMNEFLEDATVDSLFERPLVRAREDTCPVCGAVQWIAQPDFEEVAKASSSQCGCLDEVEELVEDFNVG